MLCWLLSNTEYRDCHPVSCKSAGATGTGFHARAGQHRNHPIRPNCRQQEGGQGGGHQRGKESSDACTRDGNCCARGRPGGFNDGEVEGDLNLGKDSGGIGKAACCATGERRTQMWRNEACLAENEGVDINSAPALGKKLAIRRRVPC